MVFKIKPLILKCDFIGFVPQFRILDNTRYKSIFSSLLSIIIILFSIAFISYSFKEYLHQNPKVEYYKDNDYETNKTFTLSNSLFMFEYTFLCTDPLIDYDLKITLENDNSYTGEQLEYEVCELNKNIDIKYKDVLENLEKVEGYNHNNLFCLNFNNKEFTLFSNPSFPLILEKYL